MTVLEKAFWLRLKGKEVGFRFRRQHPFPPYVLDFFCPEVRICVEIDGQHHAERVEKDRFRDAWLAERAIKTLRFSSQDVYDDLDAVLAAVLTECWIRRRDFGDPSRSL